MKFEEGESFAKTMDREDPLMPVRAQFHIPKKNGNEVTYFTGNSLGLQPKITRKAVLSEMDKWKNLGVEGHFEGENPWFHYHKFTKPGLGLLCGADKNEVVAMNTLTTNLHLLMVSFYRPTTSRYKIITEQGAFPSDQYALESQVRFHGYDPATAIVEIQPRNGEDVIDMEDLTESIQRHAEEAALLLMSGVQYYTGQFFDMKRIVELAHAAGILVGFDLAHAMGNVELNLHATDVDFAVWCSYKYLNAGPGAVGGMFVHSRHGLSHDIPRFSGWWGHDEEQRFLMKKGFVPMKGADGWQLSNVNILSSAALLASLSIFEQVGLPALFKKRDRLSDYLEWQIQRLNDKHGGIIRIITPKPHGCQLSLSFKSRAKDVFDTLIKASIVVDWRHPNVIRIAPVPLYNRFMDIYQFTEVLDKALTKLL